MLQPCLGSNCLHAPALCKTLSSPADGFHDFDNAIVTAWKTVYLCINFSGLNRAFNSKEFRVKTPFLVGGIFYSIQFNSVVQFTQFFTVYQVIYVINYFTENKFVFIKLFMLAFSLICMSCGNREGISSLPCSTLWVSMFNASVLLYLELKNKMYIPLLRWI